MEGLRWDFQLRDGITGSAKRAAGGLRQMRTELRGARRDLDRLGRGSAGAGRMGFDPRAMREIGRNARGVGGALGQTTSGLSTMLTRLGAAVGIVGGLYFAFQRIASVVGDVASAVGGLVSQFAGGVIEAGATRMRALMGMRALLGDGAEDALRQAEELSNFLGTDLHETVSSLQSMMAQGFNAREARTLFQTLADLQTINPAANISSLTLAIGQIHSKGRLMAEELMQLTEAGLNRGDLLAQLGTARGLSGDRDSVVRQVESLMSAGRIGDEEALRAIVQSVSGLTGDVTGGLARSASQGLPGLLARLEQAPDRIFTAIATDSTGAFGDLEGLLGGVVGMLDPASQGFRDFVSIASSGFAVIVDVMRTAWDIGVAFFSGLFGEASESTDPIEDIRAGLQDVRDWLGSLRETGTIDEIRSMGAGFAKFGRAVWPVVKALGILAGVVGTIAFAFINLPIILAGAAAWFAQFVAEGRLRLGEFAGMLHGYFAGLGVQAWQWGRSIVEGLSMGMQAGIASVQAAAGGIRDRVVESVRGAFDMHSPSRLMEGLGELAAAGFGRGLDAMPEVSVPVPELGGGVGQASQGRGAASMSFNIHVEVHGASDPQGTGEAVRGALEDIFDAFRRGPGGSFT